MHCDSSRRMSMRWLCDEVYLFGSLFEQLISRRTRESCIRIAHQVGLDRIENEIVVIMIGILS